MEQNKALYETIFIVKNTIGEEAVKAVVEKFTTLISENSTVESINEWGTRRLAYPVDDLTEGYYVLVRFNSEPAFPAELKRLYNINDSILRSLIIRVEE
jgi:small subunit ribosomal protein S6